jgi:hypothetical protein
MESPMTSNHQPASWADTYAAQLAQRSDELLPDMDSDARLELLGVMDPDDMRTSLAWLVSYAPQVFAFALVRDQAMTERLLDRLDEADADPDDLEPSCSRCGGKIGIFIGYGPDWHHYRGNGTAESPNELYDAGHKPAVAWREAGAK